MNLLYDLCIKSFLDSIYGSLWLWLSFQGGFCSWVSALVSHDSAFVCLSLHSWEQQFALCLPLSSIRKDPGKVVDFSVSSAFSLMSGQSGWLISSLYAEPETGSPTQGSVIAFFLSYPLVNCIYGLASNIYPLHFQCHEISLRVPVMWIFFASSIHLG